MRILLIFGIPILAIIAAFAMMMLRDKPPANEPYKLASTNHGVALNQTEALSTEGQVESDGAKKLNSQGYRAEPVFALNHAEVRSAVAPSAEFDRS